MSSSAPADNAGADTFGESCKLIPADGEGSFNGMDTAPVASAADVDKAVEDAANAGRKAVLVQVNRDDANRFVALPLADG